MEERQDVMWLKEGRGPEKVLVVGWKRLKLKGRSQRREKEVNEVFVRGSSQGRWEEA